jgi:transcriptional regulator with XRE-family HTH domain
MNIGNAIKQLRQQAGYTQCQMADMVLITQTYLSQVEAGKKTASAGTLQNIADGLNISVAVIYVMAIEAKDIQHNDPNDKNVLFALETGKQLILKSL